MNFSFDYDVEALCVIVDLIDELSCFIFFKLNPTANLHQDLNVLRDSLEILLSLQKISN